MCLGIPGQIVEITDATAQRAKVSVGGIGREINIACVIPPDGDTGRLVGEWVLVHVGFAMSRIDPDEAERTLALLTELGDMQEELDAMRASA